MEISPTLAQEIVANMQEVLNQELNYIKTDGTIIASTDQKRIGTFHEGSTIVAKTKKLLTIDHDSQYQGVKKGINIPVFFEQKIIGVIGITGNKDVVHRYGKILQKMTELLIKEAYIKDMDHQKENNERLLIESVLNYQESNTLNTSKITNFNPTTPRIIVVGKISSDIDSSSLQSALKAIKLKGFIELYTILNREVIIFVHDEKQELKILKDELLSLSEHLDKKIAWGIGTSCDSYSAIQDSYQNAKNAITWGYRINENLVTSYAEEPLSIVLSEIPMKQVDIFLNLLFHNLKHDEIIEMTEILKVYRQYNGSISKCADALFIHKNTLQYKLKKIKKTTGYDPRNIDDFFKLEMGLILYNLYQ